MAGILNSKLGVNSLSPQQLDELIQYAFTNNIGSGVMAGRRMLQSVGGPSLFPHGQVVYMTNFSSSPYPRIHIPNVLWNTWAVKPLTRDLLFHLVFWRWINGGKLCSLDPNKQISHLICYRGPDPHLKSTNFLLLREEDVIVNESRKGCWVIHPELDFLGKGRCPHKPKCRLIDYDFDILH
jgi:hypothetical protein